MELDDGLIQQYRVNKVIRWLVKPTLQDEILIILVDTFSIPFIMHQT